MAIALTLSGQIILCGETPCSKISEKGNQLSETPADKKVSHLREQKTEYPAVFSWHEVIGPRQTHLSVGQTVVPRTRF
jgi:hypothetical protein